MLLHRFVRSLVLVVTVTTVSAMPVLTIGCQGMGMQSARDQAMAMLSDSLKQQLNGYLTDVGDVTAILKNVDGVQSALETAPKLAPFVSNMQSAYSSFSSLDPETLKNVRSAFGPELAKASDGFTSQLSRAADSGTWGKMLKPVLDQVKVFQ